MPSDYDIINSRAPILGHHFGRGRSQPASCAITLDGVSYLLADRVANPRWSVALLIRSGRRLQNQTGLDPACANSRNTYEFAPLFQSFDRQGPAALRYGLYWK